MFIERLRLIHFRNCENELILPKKGINIVLGENAQGKTNLIEAMFFLSRGYSHRTSSLMEFTQWNHDGFFLEAKISAGDVKHLLSVKSQQGKKQFLLDGKAKKRETIRGAFSTILFEPDDLKIVKEGPDKRRRFLNQEISGFRPEYHVFLKNYEKILNQRNNLLKSIQYEPSLATTLDVWDDQLIQTGVRLMQHRIRYLHRLNQAANQLHQILSQKKEELSLFYLNNVIDSLAEMPEINAHYKERLASGREEEISRGITIYGPHVDDIIIRINGKDARRFGSQGQQRCAAIALKLSQIEIYFENTGEYPVILLDDVFSELDVYRRENILSLLDKTQAFITGTDDVMHDAKADRRDRYVIKMVQGKAESLSDE